MQEHYSSYSMLHDLVTTKSILGNIKYQHANPDPVGINDLIATLL
jgi:hypothetical protein